MGLAPSKRRHCNTLQHTATHCNTLQHPATHCNTLQHTAAHCNTLQDPMGFAAFAPTPQFSSFLGRFWGVVPNLAFHKAVPPWIWTKLFGHGDAKVGGKGTATRRGCRIKHNWLQEPIEGLDWRCQWLLPKYRSLLQNIVCFIGLFCKRDHCVEGCYFDTQVRHIAFEI